MEVTRISTHNRLNSKGQEVHLYTVVSGKGSGRVSVGAHMTEAEAKQLKGGA